VTAGTTSYDPTTATPATPAAAPTVWGYRDPSSVLLAIAAHTHHDVTAELTSPDAGRSSGPHPIAVELHIQRQQTVTRTRQTVDPLADVLRAGAAGTFAAAAAMPPVLQKFVHHDDCQGVFDSVSNFRNQAGACAHQVVDQVAQVATDINNKFWEVVTKVVTAVAPIVASIVVGGAVFLGCEAITGGVGSVLCATAAGTAGGAVYGAMSCPEGRATWECVAEGAVVGGLSGATGGFASELGAGALLTGALSGMVGDGAQQLITTGTIEPKELLTAGAIGAFLGWGGSKIPGLRGGRAPKDDPAGRPASRSATPDEDPAVANRRSTSSADGCRHSFDPATPVLMADGSRKAIGDVKVGDKVEATDPTTGKVESRTVTALHNNEDTDLTDLTVQTGDGRTAVLHTTQHHPFWDGTRNSWVDAAGLARGERLRTADGRTVTVVDVRSFSGRHQMRDLTVDELHTYYVLAGAAPVLVHNCGDVALGYRNQGTSAWADRNGFTHFNDLPADEWRGPVLSAIEDPRVTLHVNTKGFAGDFGTMVNNGLSRGGVAPHATEEEMAWIARAVSTGKRDWSSVNFYDQTGTRIAIPEPDWGSMDLPKFWFATE
jgi:hypothetical protein